MTSDRYVFPFTGSGERAMFHSTLRRPSTRANATILCRLGLAVAVTVLLAGCTAPRPGADLPPFGDSVRHTKQIQTYQLGDEVTPLSGDKAAEAMRTYRIAPVGGGQAPTSTQ
ncbi:hypothetical protein QC823_11105 [Halomonas vilamensis]|uniref:Uncharacterized protein n=1 Tax=Vreelandella vilamensis TaxID=531309 RepID=A0ABU1H5F9_9GAMM|nr:hypothetical protein [Halomonas vilamensis]MDR5899531.1 hypothetical protein [Halomonas vilamensis]